MEPPAELLRNLTWRDMHMKKTVVSVLALCLCLAPLAAAQSTQSSPNLEQKFTAGKVLTLQLEAGDYKIQKGAPDKVSIVSRLRNSSDASKVRFEVQETANSITIKVHTPENYSGVIQVPHRVDIVLRLTAGDLTIGELEGSKDIEVRAGDLSIDVGDPNSYGAVDVSSLAGDIDASAFHQNRSGIGRSFRLQGKGPYRLHVHLGAGDIRLTAPTPQ